MLSWWTIYFVFTWNIFGNIADNINMNFLWSHKFMNVNNVHVAILWNILVQITKACYNHIYIYKHLTTTLLCGQIVTSLTSFV